MKFADFLAKANELAKTNPEVLEMEVFQTSCFDTPYRFGTSGIYLGEVATNENGDSYVSEDGAGDEELECVPCVVIEAF
jgi:hypothetical protein